MCFLTIYFKGNKQNLTLVLKISFSENIFFKQAPIVKSVLPKVFSTRIHNLHKNMLKCHGKAPAVYSFGLNRWVFVYKLNDCAFESGFNH